MKNCCGAKLAHTHAIANVPPQDIRVSTVKMKTSCAHLKSTQRRGENFNLICLASHFASCAKPSQHWLYRWNCLYYRQFKKRRHKTEENLRFMKFNNFFPRCCLCGSKKFHFHYWRKERTKSIWIKSFRSDGRARMANLHTEGPLSEHNCAFQLHHVTKFLNASPRKKGHGRVEKNCRYFRENVRGAIGGWVTWKLSKRLVSWTVNQPRKFSCSIRFP